MRIDTKLREYSVLLSCVDLQVRDPSASLSADRRGTVSLPDPESCFGKEASSGRYAKKDRQAMINHIEHMPSVMWPLQTIWSFKNPCKVNDAAAHAADCDETACQWP